MDRRKFFKLFGGVTVIPLMPFKYKAGEKAKTPTGRILLALPTRLWVNNVELTHLCHQLDIESVPDMWVIDKYWNANYPYADGDKVIIGESINTIEKGGWGSIRIPSSNIRRIPERKHTIKVSLFNPCPTWLQTMHTYTVTIRFEDSSEMRAKAKLVCTATTVGLEYAPIRTELVFVTEE